MFSPDPCSTGDTVLRAEEFMDDGSPIKLQVTIDEKQGSAVCDFTGTGHQVIGNCNAPTAITLSALIYCLRCMIGHDVPLNQGCVKPIRVILPKASILNPTDTAGKPLEMGERLPLRRIISLFCA